MVKNETKQEPAWNRQEAEPWMRQITLKPRWIFKRINSFIFRNISTVDWCLSSREWIDGMCWWTFGHGLSPGNMNLHPARVFTGTHEDQGWIPIRVKRWSTEVMRKCRTHWPETDVRLHATLLCTSSCCPCTTIPSQSSKFWLRTLSRFSRQWLRCEDV
jgi:hypothetical protein